LSAGEDGAPAGGLHPHAHAALPAHVRRGLAAHQQAVAADAPEAEADGEPLIGLGVVALERGVLRDAGHARALQERARARVGEGGRRQRARHREAPRRAPAPRGGRPRRGVDHRRLCHRRLDLRDGREWSVEGDEQRQDGKQELAPGWRDAPRTT
jgi:hypothetical protein